VFLRIIRYFDQAMNPAAQLYCSKSELAKYSIISGKVLKYFFYCIIINLIIIVGFVHLDWISEP